MSFALFRKKQHQRSRQRVSAGGLIIMSVLIMLLLFFIWASNFELDEVTVGVGKVVPSSHEQIIQSLL